MSSIKGLRSLVRLKTRRLAQQDQAVQQARQRLQQVRTEHEAASAREHSVREAEQRAHGKLRATTTRAEGFHGRDVVTHQMLVQQAEQATAEAAKLSQAALSAVQAAQSDLAGCQAAQRRAQQQREASQARLDAALAEAERQAEDAQDEEAEETAVARLLARQRAAASPASGPARRER